MFDQAAYWRPLDVVKSDPIWNQGSLVSSSEFVDMVKGLGDNITAAEIGIAFGLNIMYMIDRCPNIKKYYAVDPHEGYQDWGPNVPHGNMQHDMMVRVGQKFLENLDAYDKKDLIEFLKKTSNDAKDLIPDNSIDFMFIDANHSTEYVRQDCHNYYSKMKKGGIFAGHDAESTSVQDGLYQFVDEMGIPRNRVIMVNHPYTPLCWMIRVL
jgi:predicted O-methyltransferase YrrM